MMARTSGGGLSANSRSSMLDTAPPPFSAHPQLKS